MTPPKHILGTFDEALASLRDNVLMMAGLAERSLDRAIKGLLKRDDNLCATAIADDEEIDQLEKQIDKDGVDVMFKDSIEAFVREDVDLARAVVARDDALDKMNKMANRSLTERMAQDPEQLRGYLNLIFVSRCLERVGDHAANIAEDAVYAAAAEDIRHPPFIPAKTA